MKRTVTLMLVMAAALLASATASAAKPSAPVAGPPFGSFGGITGGGNAGAGLLGLQGWALDDSGIAWVDIVVDGAIAGRADYGRNRPGVALLYPGYPDSPYPGWAFLLDTTHYLNGNHTITPRVHSKAGEVVDLKSRTVQFLNVSHNLVPFGKVEFPNAQAEMRGKCDTANPNRRLTVISGYALDAGVQDYDTGVGYVELLLDRGLILANSRLDCFFDVSTGGFSDCYGISRLDLETLFPGLKDAPHSGFRFVLDIGELIGDGFYNEGAHVLTIRAGDHADQVATVAELPVTFICDEHAFNELSIGNITQPSPGQQLSGKGQVVSGWALDWEGVQQIQILIDGLPAGIATQGFPIPWLASFYPGYPQIAAPGWAIYLDTTPFSNGPHVLEAVVTDVTGSNTFIGKRPVVINNPANH